MADKKKKAADPEPNEEDVKTDREPETEEERAKRLGERGEIGDVGDEGDL